MIQLQLSARLLLTGVILIAGGLGGATQASGDENDPTSVSRPSKPLPYAKNADQLSVNSGCKERVEAFRSGARQGLDGEHYLFTGFAVQQISLQDRKIVAKRQRLGSSGLDREKRACGKFRGIDTDEARSDLECCIQGYYAGTNRLAELIMEDSKKPASSLPEEVNECFRSFQQGVIGSDLYCKHEQAKRDSAKVSEVDLLGSRPGLSCPSLNILGVSHLGCHFLGFISGFTSCPCDTLQSAKEKLGQHAPSVSTLSGRKYYVLPMTHDADEQEAQSAGKAR